MTTCGGQRAEAVAEQYLRGELPEADAQGFEEHYLECDACFEYVRALQSVRYTLQQKPSVVPMRPPAWTAFAVAAAAILIVALAVHWNSSRVRQQAAVQAPVEQKITPPVATSSKPIQQEAPAVAIPEKPLQLASLADKSLPPFHATQLRGASEDEHFEAGMRVYAASDCVTAVDELMRVPRESERADAAALYAGACQYLRRNFDAAGQLLGPLAKNQDSPFSEAARYYLAQTELLKNNSVGAQHWLNEVVALHGDYEARARAQLQQVKSAR